MVILLAALGLGVLGYLYWRWRFTTLTRDCRWREDRPRGIWRCAACGAETTSEGAPRICLRGQQ